MRARAHALETANSPLPPSPLQLQQQQRHFGGSHIQQFFQMTWLRKNLLLVATIGAVLLGGILGFVIRSQRPSPSTIMLISFPGQ